MPRVKLDPIFSSSGNNFFDFSPKTVWSHCIFYISLLFSLIFRRRWGLCFFARKCFMASFIEMQHLLGCYYLLHTQTEMVIYGLNLQTSAEREREMNISFFYKVYQIACRALLRARCYQEHNFWLEMVCRTLWNFVTWRIQLSIFQFFNGSAWLRMVWKWSENGPKMLQLA
jgi:hypothetical protein